MNKINFLSTGLLVGLLMTFGGQVYLTSIDAVYHYVLTHEIGTFGYVRPGVASDPVMDVYPAASHRLAAIIGWIGGSDLVAIQLVLITSIFVSYILITRLAEAERGLIGTAVFALVFFALKATRSQVGFEVVINFFYPQLVGDVVYFGVLYWLATGERELRHTVLVVLVAATGAMWLQPITAIHIIGLGATFLALLNLREWINRRFSRSLLVATAVTTIGGVAIFALHPVMKVMKFISLNNGALAFGYSDRQLAIIVPICALLGIVSVFRWIRKTGTRIDAAVGAAVIAASFILLLQYLALELFGMGSPYAVKKHMFLITTLGAINLARLISDWRWPPRVPVWPEASSVFAAFATVVILYKQGIWSGPLREALAYADYTARFRDPKLAPGNTASANPAFSPLANIMVSVSAFDFPLTNRAFSWVDGARPENDADYVMIPNIPRISNGCSERFGEARAFVIVSTKCLNHYTFGEKLSLTAGSDTIGYLKSGWHAPEEWGTWSAKEAVLDLQLPAGVTGALNLIVEAQGFIVPKHPSQTVVVTVNGTKVAAWSFNAQSAAGERRATIPAGLIKDGKMTIDFASPDAISPVALGLSADPRVIGIGLKSFVIEAARD